MHVCTSYLPGTYHIHIPCPPNWDIVLPGQVDQTHTYLMIEPVVYLGLPPDLLSDEEAELLVAQLTEIVLNYLNERRLH